MRYRITAKDKNGVTRNVYFAGDNAESCAGAMVAHSCASNRRHVLNAITGRNPAGSRTFSATNSKGELLIAERVTP